MKIKVYYYLPLNNKKHPEYINCTATNCCSEYNIACDFCKRIDDWYFN